MHSAIELGGLNGKMLDCSVLQSSPLFVTEENRADCSGMLFTDFQSMQKSSQPNHKRVVKIVPFSDLTHT